MLAFRFAIATLLASSLSPAQEIPPALEKQMKEMGAAPFKGAPKLGLIATPSTGLVDLGLTTEKLQREIELVLRRNGIEPISFFDAPKTQNSGYLKLFALVRPSTRGRYAYSVRLKYDENVIPVRQSIIQKQLADSMSGTLWEREDFGEDAAANVVNSVMTLCLDMTSDLALDYLRANPRQH
jgi:hypothetical protein